MPKKPVRAPKAKKLPALKPKAASSVRGGGINRIVVTDGKIRA
jgi:hypothetical protein